MVCLCKEGSVAFAHSANPRGQRHGLAAHLQAVAALAAQFAAPLGAPEAAHWLGIWHDLGKFSPEFQQYLLDSEAGRARRIGPDHKALGASVAARHAGALALLIQGHHGALHSPAEFQAWLGQRRNPRQWESALAAARRALARLEPAAPIGLPAQVEGDALAAELFLRLLYSALVDADYLDTEAHFAGDSAATRGSPATISGLWAALEQAQTAITGRGQDAVAQARHEVYQACLAAAAQPPGIFRLTVPTGGGKTRSAMAFALRHALLHGQDRVIVAIPFISITEQTADVYRAIFEAEAGSPRAVLEHHSGAAPAEEDDSGVGEGIWARLAAENWDAPIVVTTTVQLFESLFANTPAKARKLHRLANSVILLDEAQALPAHLLEPILDVLQQLARHYHSTIVISTATQPAFEAIPAFRGLAATEIVPDAARLFSALERVRYEWRLDPPLPWGEVAAIMRAEPQALAVVNTKRDALALLDALGDPQALHLSTLLCGAHRRGVIAEVRRRLAAGLPCRVVSTQVVEAGVDLDFPLVLRALAPLDAIIQAAGRCNREGRLERGRVVVFEPQEGGLPPGPYRAATGVTRALVEGARVDLGSPSAPALYFQRLYQTIATDRGNVQALRSHLNFPEVAREFRMIDEDTESVAVRYGTPEQQAALRRLLDQLQARAGNPRRLMRALQPYLVSIRRREAERLRRAGLVGEVVPGLGEWLGHYDPVRGLAGADPEAESLIV